MTPPAALGAGHLRAAMVAYRDALRSHREELNALNVYPVPDGDTGTNMALTLEAVVKELDGLDRRDGRDTQDGRHTPDGPGAMADVCRAVAHGSLMGARGNSGVILSQLLRGIADGLDAADEALPEALAEALVSAGDLARRAVARPVEGTILTVADAAGEGARAGAKAGSGLLGVVEAAREAAREALERTPDLLEALRAAGVVDAGGAGYVLFFDALLAVLDGRPLPVPDMAAPAGEMARGGAQAGDAGEGVGPRPAAEGGTGDLRFEVMYFLDAPDDAIAAFRDVWTGIGDSIVVVGGDGLWNCHIHTDDVGAAIEAALDIGRPRQIRVTDLAEQVQEERWVRDAALAAPERHARDAPDAAAPATAVVAVVAGEGVGRIFRSLGATRLVTGGQSMNPSTAQLLEAVESVGSDDVVLLPNNENVEPVALQVDALTAKSVSVVPTGSIVEGFAALLAYDPAAPVGVNAAAMTASASRVVPGAVTRAVRDASTPGGPVSEGDWIGVSREGVLAVSDSAEGAALGLLDALLTADHELVTVIEGEGSTPAATRRVTEWLHEEHPAVAAEVHHGGQPLYPYLFGVE